MRPGLRAHPSEASVRRGVLDEAPGQGLGSTVAAGFPRGRARTRRTPRRLVPTPPARLREGRGAQWCGRRGSEDPVKWRGAAHCAQRWGGARCLVEGGPHGARGGMGWAGAPCPEPLPGSNLALFLPRRNNFLLPRPRAQELRGEVLGRSFAILEPDDDTAAHGPRGSFPRPLPRARPAGLQGPDTG